ncbi:MAG: hypothetical protein JSU01_21075 [Bacteroidetes bacterium]|nr:hypothetical protein [Bacteroidota bacterium]
MADSKTASQTTLYWRIMQSLFWLIGAGILFCLLFFPSIGLLLFWNILIPVAPALLVVSTGLWRNICPLATTALLPRHFGLSKRKKLKPNQSGILGLIAVIMLFLIVPLRHAVFNNNGPATAALIISLTTIGVAVGFRYEWKSAWCSGLCPIHPVERLYGGNSFISIPNMHCDLCANCVVPCPDSTRNLDTGHYVKMRAQRISNFLITGGLPGFIWGWFHVPDQNKLSTAAAFAGVYTIPLLGLLTTLLFYRILQLTVKSKNGRALTGLFAASAVSCYYWYRLPGLFGFGYLGRDGLLLDINGLIPGWTVHALAGGLVCFFFYWLVIRINSRRSWLIRPEFAKRHELNERKLAAKTVTVDR